MIEQRIAKYFTELSTVEQDQIEAEQFTMLNIAGVPIGKIEMEHGVLVRVGLFDTEDMLEHVSEIDSESIIAITDAFVKDFETRPLHFEMMSDLDAFYLVEYEARDRVYDLALPNSGVYLTIRKDGQLLSANFFIEEYTVEYPEILVTAQQAKDILYKETLVQLGIQVDKDFDHARYVYEPRHQFIAVNIDGSIENAYKWQEVELPTYNLLDEVKVETSLETLLGVTDDLKMVRTSKRMKWFEPGKFDTPVVTVNESTEGWTYETDHNSQLDERISQDAALQRAQSFIALHVDEDLSYYQLEVLPKNYYEDEFDAATNFKPEYDEESESDEEDAHVSYEPTYDFKFVPFFDKIRLDITCLEVSVGIYSGFVRYASIPKHPFKKLTQLQNPNLTLKEADCLYKEDLELTLTRKQIPDNNYYSLTYLIDFPKTLCAIEYIDAVTGKINYVETGFVKIK